MHFQDAAGVLRASRGVCELCGAGPSPGHPLHVDHIKPRSRYPELELDPSNLQVLCEDCNLGKSNTDAIDWRTKSVG
jgi:5-methylcytosine-specific restriction endonuclease McrA